ncbi:unnamed protein product [Citrullus colocynthis]|uniref:Protein FAM136A n=2 Tax=Benincaseae TaxID=1003877 RepID=A0ABP0Z1L9_9ROSI
MGPAQMGRAQIIKAPCLTTKTLNHLLHPAISVYLLCFGEFGRKKMNHIAAMEEQVVSERMRQKLNEVNMAAQSHLGPIQDHVNFSLQQAYFKCAYECFDRRRRQEEISNCVENCSVPVVKAQQHVENEMAKFQERLNRSLMVCQDKFEAARLQQKTGSVYDLESCVDASIQESLNTLPHLANKLKASFNISN